MTKNFDNLHDARLITLLKNGGVGVLPTDTVYGLVCAANNRESVVRLYALKNRDKKPGTLIAASMEQLVNIGIKARYLKAVEQFWPGAVSVVIPFNDPSTSYLRQGLPDIAVRIPEDKNINTLLAKVGPLLTTSANAPGKEPASNIQEAKVYFGQEVDFYVNGGNLKDRQPSTIIRMVDDAIELIRAGAVKIDQETGRIAK